ncbi:cupin domain-containing protein [Clostridium rectalis]|uniref:cupin domain-containing protein n=1 Tax=Clostridium rectalis TaxID=2040295 RepID=UPI000F62FC24|nr:cupin domain-containing protein [Clostridium rectalis]
MYNMFETYPCPYCFTPPIDPYIYPYYYNTPMYDPYFENYSTNDYMPLTGEIEYDPTPEENEFRGNGGMIPLKDYGPQPFVVNIEKATTQNNKFRTTLWTGKHLQVTLMSIKVGEDIGLEIHPKVDQFIRIEEGEALVQMGDRKDKLNFEKRISDDYAIMVPAGKWHNITNIGRKPLKLYSIYAPPEHPFGTVHETKAIAEAAEEKRRR